MAKTAIELLEQDHEQMKELLERLTETTERATKTRTELLAKIAVELEAHTRIEEEIFYPAFRDALGDKEAEKLYYEATEEHNAAKMVLKDIQKADVSTPAFSGKAKVLKELIEHHVEEEEETLFPKAKKALGKDALQELGEQMDERKKQLIAKRSNGSEARAH